MDIKFSIAIPAYKSSFLKECIESILQQGYSNFEIIIVDDDSPENIKAIVEPFLSDYRVYFYQNEKNFGAINVVDNWNKCLGYATGDYIICMGDDDRLLPNCLEEYVRLIKKYPEIGIVHGWTELIDENSKFLCLTAPRPEYESVYSFIWNRWNNRFHQYIGDFCFHIEWLREKGGFYKLPMAWESDDISAAIGAMKSGIANSQCLCFQYRVNSHTISMTGDIKVKMEAMSQGRKWYMNFLYIKPESSIDCKFHQMLLMDLQKYYDKKFGHFIFKDMIGHAWRIFRWLHKGKRYGYSFRALGYATILWMKR